MISTKWFKHIIVIINHDKKKIKSFYQDRNREKSHKNEKKKQKVNQIKMNDFYQFFECYLFV
jgi:hypothetical protein